MEKFDTLGNNLAKSEKMPRNNLAKMQEHPVTLSCEGLLGEIFVGINYSSGEIFIIKRKIRHFRPTKNFAS